MKIRLGYACLPVGLNTTASSIMTYSYYKRLGKINGDLKLNSIILSNLNSLEEILKYNIRNDIIFFRMTSNLIPLGTHPDVDFEVFEKYKKEFKNLGKIIKNNNLRVDMHPDQFCVLNSINADVVKSTINILEFNQKMYKYMNLESKLVLHIGSKVGGKRESINRFIYNFNNLNDSLKKIIVLENDDKVYNIRNVLKVCNKLDIPMVLDYHHFLCNKNNEKIEDFIQKIFSTWKNETPKIHFSSPKNKKEFRTHNDYIDAKSFIEFIEKIKFINRDFDIMIEAKAKEEALFRLIRQLKYYGYDIKSTTIYIK